MFCLNRQFNRNHKTRSRAGIGAFLLWFRGVWRSWVERSLNAPLLCKGEFVLKYLLSLFLLTAVCASAVTVDLPMTNVCEFADNERNIHASLGDYWQSGNLRVFTLYVTASADTNTVFFAAFGEDSVITNSLMESSEISVCFGWNAGKWEIRPGGLRERYTASPASTTDGDKTLFVRMRVTAAGEVSELEFRDGGPQGTELTFGGLDLSGGVPAYFRPQIWNTLRWTTRGGASEKDAQATAKFFGTGATLIVR